MKIVQFSTSREGTNLKRILIVDDDPATTSRLETALNDDGLKEIDVYNDPIAVLKDFRIGLYELSILDVAMPTMDGFRLYHEMKKRDDNIRALFVTAIKINYEVLRDLFTAYGADMSDDAISAILADSGGRFIKKPIEIPEFIARVRREMEQKRICRFCGWDLDEQDPKILTFFHSECWKEYRKLGLVDPMPGDTW